MLALPCPRSAGLFSVAVLLVATVSCTEAMPISPLSPPSAALVRIQERNFSPRHHGGAHHHGRHSGGDEAPTEAGGRGPGVPDYGGYVINQMGYGNYTAGPNGGFGGYPPGSPQAEELMNNQRYKCDFVPESC